MKKEMDKLARKAKSLEGSNSNLALKLEAQREELTNRVQQAQFQAAEARSSSVPCPAHRGKCLKVECNLRRNGHFAQPMRGVYGLLSHMNHGHMQR